MTFRLFLLAAIFTLTQLVTFPLFARHSSIENRVLRLISNQTSPHITIEERCDHEDKYIVYLIDNFTQTINLLPEIETSHGELLHKMLISGRKNIDVKVLNTPLSDGLAHVLKDLMKGKCVNAIISSTPGSNYTYGQIKSLLGENSVINSSNILLYRNELKQLLEEIAFKGFPSFEWLKNIDANPIKLKSDARVLAFIEALDRYEVPVYLPYGNADSKYRGQIRSINILSVSNNAYVYSALNQYGERLKEFPYSPLSTGDELASFELIECTHPTDPFRAMLDVNEDGYYDYSYQKFSSNIDLFEKYQSLSVHILISGVTFQILKENLTENQSCRPREVVQLTKNQLWELSKSCIDITGMAGETLYAKLAVEKRKEPQFFSVNCWSRGRISGTSLIPPNKVKEYLP